MNEFEQLRELLSLHKPQQADAIILLAGDRFHRVAKVAELYHAKHAPKVVLTSNADDWEYGSLPSSKLVPELLRHNILEGDIIWEESAPHTRAEADATLRIAQKKDWKTLLLVTTHYHAPRALLAWVKARADLGVKINFVMIIVAEFPEFKKESEDEALLRELERIALYQEKGDIASFKEGIEYLTKNNFA